ncbi:MAG: hypothetical protein QM731_09625 [Chitinophagaceae bacterium]
MPVLEINCLNNTQWLCQVPNTGISYPFYGSSVEQQATNVVAFANSMKMNQANYAVGFLDDTDGVTTEQLVQQIFGENDQLYYLGQYVYGTLGGENDYLIDELVDAGVDLLTILGG